MSTLSVAPVSALNCGASLATTAANWSFCEARLRVTPSSGLAAAPMVSAIQPEVAKPSRLRFVSAMFPLPVNSPDQTIHQTKAHSSALDKFCFAAECHKTEHYRARMIARSEEHT